VILIFSRLAKDFGLFIYSEVFFYIQGREITIMSLLVKGPEDLVSE